MWVICSSVEIGSCSLSQRWVVNGREKRTTALRFREGTDEGHQPPVDQKCILNNHLVKTQPSAHSPGQSVQNNKSERLRGGLTYKLHFCPSAESKPHNSNSAQILSKSFTLTEFVLLKFTCVALRCGEFIKKEGKTIVLQLFLKPSF